jgi:cytochrome P450
LPAAVQTAAFMADPTSFLDRCRHRYGDVFETRFLGMGRFVYVCDPQLVKQVFAADRDIGLAGEARKPFMEAVLGSESLLTTDGEQWERQRKLLGPPFHGELIEAYRSQIEQIAAAEVERWPLGMPMPLRPRMQAITLEVILRLVFGIEDAARFERLRALLTTFTETGHWMFWMPGFVKDLIDRTARAGGTVARLSPWTRVQRRLDEIDRLLYEEIALRRADPAVAERADILSLLIAGGDASDSELRDELMTLLMAGHETTATSLSWAFERLARHPRVVARLREEIEAGEGEEYLDAVAKETLRIRPVITDVIRLLREPMRLNGWEIPTDRYVAPAIVAVQRRGDIHDDRLEFKPERFIGNPGTFAGWIPFGGGRRRCVGSHMAMLEMKVVIRAVLERVDLEAPDPRPERARLHHVTLIPARGATVTVRPRATPGSNGTWRTQSDSRSSSAPGPSSAARPHPAGTATA